MCALLPKFVKLESYSRHIQFGSVNDEPTFIGDGFFRLRALFRIFFFDHNDSSWSFRWRNLVRIFFFDLNGSNWSFRWMNLVRIFFTHHGSGWSYDTFWLLNLVGIFFEHNDSGWSFKLRALVRVYLSDLNNSGWKYSSF